MYTHSIIITRNGQKIKKFLDFLPVLSIYFSLECQLLLEVKIKTNAVKHRDIGQMNMYMGYIATEENMPDDNPPIGIILSKEKDELLVEYATYGMDSNLFVSKYELYLPNRDELKRLVDRIIEEDIRQG